MLIPWGLYSLGGKTSYHKISSEVSKLPDSGLDFSDRSAEKFESDTFTITSNLTASRVHEICR